MKLDALRSMIKPLSGMDRTEEVSRMLRSTGWALISLASALVLLDVVVEGGWSFSPRKTALLMLIASQGVVFGALRLGHINAGAFCMVVSFWGALSYHAWNYGGVHDSGVQVYLLLVLITSLVLNWRIALLVSVASLASVWLMAVAETRRLLAPHLATPFEMARDSTAVFILLIVFVISLVGVLRRTLEKIQEDFAARLLAEQSLREGEEKFKKIFHSNPVAIIISSLEDGSVLDANAAYWRLTGFDPGAAKSLTTVDLGIWRDASARREFVARLRERKTLHNPAYEFVNERGEKRITIAYYDLIDVEGTPGILSIFYDITQLKQAEDALLKSEARMRALLEAIPDLIFELDRDGRILQFIPSAVSEPLVPPDDFIGRPIAEIIPSIADQANFAIQRALESGQVNAFEYPLRQNEEEKIFEARIVAIGKDTVLAMVRDVTLIKWAVAEREKLINELEIKNAELERFVYTVSHDLKSPIVTIVGFLGYLEEDIAKQKFDVLKRDVERIYQAAFKMQDLLQDLLELSRIGRLKNESETIPFTALAKDAIELTAGRLQERRVDVRIQPDLPMVVGDRKRLLELLQNLIDNAAKYMGTQQKPVIEIGYEGFRERQAVLFVRDNGIGIAKEYHEQIFGLFNKLDSTTEGTGIGLAISKRIVEVHGGAIWVDSEPGKGATLYFTLPAQPA